jgi:hypothetical protein
VLRQLARLTRPLPAAGPDALAVAVYADAADHLVAAHESGFEGVACVDDAARLLDVLCDVWTATRLPWAERWARGLLAFVLWMQEPDGRWINFVRDWEGSRNVDGITSAPGENFWHARALLGVSHAWLTFEDERAEAATFRGLDHAVMRPAAPDVRALHVIAAQRLIEAGHAAYLRVPLANWVGEIVACRDDDVLKNSPYERDLPHLWAHVQEGALASAASLVGAQGGEVMDVARRSAEALVVPAVASGFAASGTSPYDVAACVYSLDRLAEVTGDPRWPALAADARAWFDGRNPAGAPVYDRRRGRVADGVDGGRISENSGAEANIVGAEALLGDAIAVASTLDDPFVGTSSDPTVA